jgi:predicted metal-dependent hydrolase
MEKDKLKSRVLLIVLVTWGVLFILLLITFIDNQDLQSTVSSQNDTIKQIFKNDSIQLAKSKSYSDTIKKYATSYSIKIDNKEYTFEEFVKLYDKVEKENYAVKDSLRQYKEAMSTIQKKAKQAFEANKKYLDSLNKVSH